MQKFYHIKVIYTNFKCQSSKLELQINQQLIELINLELNFTFWRVI